MAARPTRWLETGAAATRPSLLGRIVGVTVRYGSFGRFRVRRVQLEPPMSKLSAGLLLYRRTADGIEVLVAHPGGPMWARRDTGAWSLPKGAPHDHEEPDGPVIDLGEVRMRSGKTVHAWAVEGNLDPRSIESMTVELEWPPRTGTMVVVPEIDRVAWVRPPDARRRLNPAQAEFVDRLLRELDRR
jgi:predicted NUDIX family NTP pyrophosphohydrolase